MSSFDSLQGAHFVQAVAEKPPRFKLMSRKDAFGHIAYYSMNYSFPGYQNVWATSQSACPSMFVILHPPSLIQYKLHWAKTIAILSHTYYIKCATWKKRHPNPQIFSEQVCLPEKRPFSAILEGQTPLYISRFAGLTQYICFQPEILVLVEANNLYFSIVKTDFSYPH